MTRRPGPEEILLEQIIDLAHLHGWLVYHQRPARTARGWRTAVQGDKGFMDLVLARKGFKIFAELKSDTGKLTDDQAAWLEAVSGLPAALWLDGTIQYCYGAESKTFVWRPHDWDEIVATLGGYDTSRSRDVAPGSTKGA